MGQVTLTGMRSGQLWSTRDVTGLFRTMCTTCNPEITNKVQIKVEGPTGSALSKSLSSSSEIKGETNVVT